MTITFLFLVGLIGLLVGSFLNVVVHRLPIILQQAWQTECRVLLKLPEEKSEKFNLLLPRSHCPHCKHPLRIIDNIPVISYFLSKGKCAHCQHKINIRYPILETLSAVLSIVVAVQFGINWQLIAGLIFTWGLLSLTFIDLEHELLPDVITLPLLWLGLLLNLFNVFTDIHSAVIGAVSGYISLWLVAWIFQRITGKVGMGHGDFKLFALIGAWTGWQLLPFIILISSVLGSIIGIILILLKKQDRQTPIPFGPYLILAGWLGLLWGPSWLQIYWTIV